MSTIEIYIYTEVIDKIRKVGGFKCHLQTTQRGKTLIASLPTCASTCNSFLPRQCLHICTHYYNN